MGTDITTDDVRDIKRMICANFVTELFISIEKIVYLLYIGYHAKQKEINSHRETKIKFSVYIKIHFRVTKEN